MAKIIFTIVLIAFTPYISNCQYFSVEWQACFGGSELDLPDNILYFNNKYVIVGGTESDDGDVTINYGAEDGWVIMIDSIGNLIWEKTFGGSKGDEIIKALETDDGNIFLIGETWSSDGTIDFNPFPNSENCWVLKIDTLGNIEWQKLFGGSGNELILDVAKTSDGGIVFVGWTTSEDGDVSEYFGGYDTWIVKLDSLGQIEWDKTIGTNLGFEFGYSIIQTSDGGYLVGITANPLGEGNVTCIPHSSDPEGILFKLDSIGNEVWQNCYGGTNDDGIYIVKELPDGYLFGGGTWSNDGDLTGAGYHWDQSDIWIAKIDFNGNSIWHKCFGGTRSERPHEIFLTEDNGFFIIGSTNSDDCDVIGNHSNGTFWHDVWAFKIDEIGTLEYQQCIGGIADETLSFWAATKKSQYNYVIAGMTTWSPSFDVNCDCYNNTIPDYWIFEISDTTVGLNELSETGEIGIFPNPTNRILNIYFPDYYNIGKYILILEDMEGRTQYRLDIDNSTRSVDLNELASGLYLLRIINDNKVLLAKKLLIH